MSTVSIASPQLLVELRDLLGAENVIDSGETLETLSKDFYWYSPVLKRLLDKKSAAVAVRVSSLEQLRGTLAACSRAGVPVTPRGGGTGNYGQCVPLHGGVVIDLTRFDRINEITADGVVRAEPGARLLTIETEARKKGWELRCLPSTWVKSSIGGFFGGGSGGIGSITWGGIGAPGNVKSITLMSCEAEPRTMRFEEADALRALRGYGTTGIMIEVEMRLAPKLDYDQLIFSSPDWDKLLDWSDAAARRPEWRKRLSTQFQWPIPMYFKPLKKYLRADEHISFLLIERSQTAEVIAHAEKAGLACVYRTPLSDPPKPPFISDYTYNHTTLWAMNTDPSFTYLQAGFAANFREQFAALHARFPGEILLHLEWMAAEAHPDPVVAGAFFGAPVFVAAIPLVRFVSEARLQEIIDYCAEIGVGIANPHTYSLERGGHHPNIEAKRALKAELDPGGLLNPGKMQTYAHNPFADQVT
jgi:FAD/FMN-containing dehydrogenase